VLLLLEPLLALLGRPKLDELGKNSRVLG